MRDLLGAAKAAGVEADRGKIAEGVALFAERFVSQPVEIRTTSLDPSKREVSFRFVDESARGEVWKEARDWYQIGGEARALLDAVTGQFGVRAEGVDADVRLGFRKVWAFLDKGYASRRFEGLPGAPAALAKIRSVLEKHGVQHLSIVGVDPANGTCNLYPMLRPGWASAGAVAALAADLGLPALPTGWLELAERSVAGNFTFRWGSDRVERLAFYRPAMSPDELPDDAVLRGFALGCPIVAPQRVFIPSITYAHGTSYRKVEVDYDGNIVPVLVRCAQVPNE